MRARRSNDSTSTHDQKAVPEDGRPVGSARRWEIWAQQAAAGKLPCFASDQRFTCREPDCPWHDECQHLRAEWQR